MERGGVLMAGLKSFEVPEKLAQQQLAVLEKAKKSGKIRVGINETTKAIERGTAKLVLIARDTEPEEIVMHLPIICREKSIPFSFANTKKELGEKAGIQVGTASVAVVEEGEAKKELQDIQKKLLEIQK